MTATLQIIKKSFPEVRGLGSSSGVMVGGGTDATESSFVSEGPQSNRHSNPLSHRCCP